MRKLQNITTRRVSFEVARLCLSQPDASVLKLRVCRHPNPLRQRGIVLLRFTQCLGKSLAHASGYDKPLCFRPLDLPQSGNAQLQN